MNRPRARSSVRRAMELLLARGGAASLARRGVRGRYLILAYHNVVPHGDVPGGDRSLHVPQARFARHLDLITELCHVVSLSDLLGFTPASSNGPRDRPHIAITFDDAYRGALTAGLDELRVRALPATVFVAPGLLTEAFWWDEYLSADADDRRRLAFEESGGEAVRVRAAAAARGWERQEVPSHAHASSFAELQCAVAVEGITLGSHTWSHPSLPRLDALRLATELSQPYEWLQQRFGRAVLPVVAYPYGHADTRAREEAARAGYVAGLRVDGGWLPPMHHDPFQVPRCNVPAELTDEGLVLRLSGVIRR